MTLAAACAAYIGLRRTGSLEEYDVAVAAMRSPMAASPQSEELVRYATLAANSHNTQPWQFQIREDRIQILPDFARRTPAVDPDDHHLFASLGCAVENLALAGRARGHPGVIYFDTADGGSVSFNFGGGPPAETFLFDAIPLRQSTRTEYDGRMVSTSDIQALKAAAAMPGVDLVLLTDRTQVDRVRDLVMTGNSASILRSRAQIVASLQPTAGDCNRRRLVHCCHRQSNSAIVARPICI